MFRIKKAGAKRRLCFQGSRFGGVGDDSGAQQGVAIPAADLRKVENALDTVRRFAKCKSIRMTPAAHTEYKAKARIIKALAHPSRLFIVDELSRGERCVAELTVMIGVEMPTVSRHLSQLKEAGIIEDEKRGAQVFYRLRVPCVLNFFHCVEAVQKNGRGRG